jgi:hypothetical protein
MSEVQKLSLLKKRTKEVLKNMQEASLSKSINREQKFEKIKHNLSQQSKRSVRSTPKPVTKDVDVEHLKQVELNRLRAMDVQQN